MAVVETIEDVKKQILATDWRWLMMASSGCWCATLNIRYLRGRRTMRMPFGGSFCPGFSISSYGSIDGSERITAPAEFVPTESAFRTLKETSSRC